MYGVPMLSRDAGRSVPGGKGEMVVCVCGKMQCKCSVV